VSILGKPRGNILPLQGYLKFSTYGIGAINVRVTEGNGPCLVRLDQGSTQAISVYSDPNLLKAAADDANRALGH
jgi:hypothetical protein